MLLHHNQPVIFHFVSNHTPLFLHIFIWLCWGLPAVVLIGQIAQMFTNFKLLCLINYISFTANQNFKILVSTGSLLHQCVLNLQVIDLTLALEHGNTMLTPFPELYAPQLSRCINTSDSTWDKAAGVAEVHQSGSGRVQRELSIYPVQQHWMQFLWCTTVYLNTHNSQAL